jgi:hypothetical protein
MAASPLVVISVEMRRISIAVENSAGETHQKANETSRSTVLFTFRGDPHCLLWCAISFGTLP